MKNNIFAGFFMILLAGAVAAVVMPTVFAAPQEDPLADFRKKPCGGKDQQPEFIPDTYFVAINNLHPDYAGFITPFNINTFGKEVNEMVGLPMKTDQLYYFEMPQVGKLAILFTPEEDHLGYHMVGVEVFKKQKGGQLERIASNHAGFACVDNTTNEEARMRWPSLGLEVVMRRIAESERQYWPELAKQ